MNVTDIQDVLEVSQILDRYAGTDITQSEAIASLLDWKNGGGGNIAPAPSAPEPVAQQDHSVAEEAVAKVEKAAPKPAKAAAPTKAAAKGRAKPPPPPVDDDDSKEPSPDPSDDDADF